MKNNSNVFFDLSTSPQTLVKEIDKIKEKYPDKIKLGKIKIRKAINARDR